MTTSQSPSRLGATYDPLGADLADTYPFYARARREEPVFFAPRFQAWIVTRYDDVVTVLRNPEVFSSANALRPLVHYYPATLAELGKGYPLGLTAVGSDGADHQRLRAPFARGLSPERVNAVTQFIHEQANALVDRFIDDGNAELMEQYANPLPFRVIAYLVGVDEADMDEAYAGSVAHALLNLSQLPEGEQLQAARGSVAFQRMMARYIADRRAAPRDDLASEVVTALAPGTDPIPLEQEAEVIWALVGLVLAGHTTTSGMMGSGIRHLLSHRDQWALLCQQPELVRNAVEEIARYDTSVQGFFRITTKEATLGAVRLPAGAELMLAYGSANRDEALTSQADTFDITRPPTRHLAWATGPHRCVGAGLARAQLAATLAVLTKRLPRLRLSGDEGVELRPSLAMRGPRALFVDW
jgi:cytochrome P450